MTTQEPGTLHLSIAGIPPEDRGRAVQQLYERKLFPVQLNPVTGKEIRFRAIWKKIPGVNIVSGYYCGLRAEALVESAGNDDLTLALSRGIRTVFSQRGREMQVEPGTAFVTTREFGVFSLTGIAAGQSVGLRVPRKAIEPLVPDIDHALKRLMIPGSSALQLLARYAQTVAEDGAAPSPEFNRLIALQIHELLAFMLGASRDAAEFVKTRGVKAARLRLVKADVMDHLSDHDLSPSVVAARQGVSPRYVHKLFEGEGTSFSEFVLAERLTKAHRILSDRRFHDRLISSIAFAAGFGDLSHFNHCFRRRYGVTPSDVRAQAQPA